jgi:hypothetical protein
MSRVDSCCVLKFRGPAIVLETNIVNWSAVSSPGRRNPCELKNKTEKWHKMFCTHGHGFDLEPTGI